MTTSRVRRPRPSGPRLVYGETRSRILTGDVLLFQGTSVVSRFIRWGSRSPYSHAGLALWWHERLMVVQSASRGVEVLPASTAVHRYDGQVDWWQPSESVRTTLDVATLVHAAFDALGKPYATLPLLALVARMFRGREWGNPDVRRESDTYFCSQLVSRCYRKAGVDLVMGKADHDTSPGDLSASPRLVYRGVLQRHPEGITIPLPLNQATPHRESETVVR
ncbi:MAG: hypothetical protein L0Y66_20595 [Myxococcaceae bacterium]|nr:hypothetical protein [Myxococcaceae bacterium]MCI0672550.1 hypothetical protein [Myxococcaceae bacterium]